MNSKPVDMKWCVTDDPATMIAAVAQYLSAHLDDEYVKTHSITITI